MEETREVIRNIKKELRLFMNGVTSAQQRKLGMEYNIIFGVDIPHLKKIAEKFTKDADVAYTLWKENIRESKLLAIFLLPEDRYQEVADRWIGECRYSENADHLAQNILCRLPDACSKAIEWIGNDNAMHIYCGYMTLCNLFRKGETLSQENEKRLFASASRHLSGEMKNANAPQALRALTLYFDKDEKRAARYEMFKSGETKL